MTLQEWTARRALVLYMSELSERYWCAGWLGGWETRCRPDGEPGGLGGAAFNPAEQHTLRLLNEAAGGWWPSTYDEVARYEDSPLPPSDERATDDGVAPPPSV